jgi:dTDP-4-dehydrorhamnose reductase
MKILLLGANGQVGFELARSLAPLGELHLTTREMRAVSGFPLHLVDLANPESLGNELAALAPDVVVNAAAYTAVDRAEDEEPMADRINHHALTVLGAWAARDDKLVVHYSTDYVFDGQATRPYREDDVTSPLGVYGRTKLAGEEALRASGCRHLIFRTAWVYASRGHNFLRTMLRVGRERGAVRVVDDQRGAPTTARLIADVTASVLARLAERPQSVLGTYHLAAGGECSWFDFARAIFTFARAAGVIDRQVEVAPIATADYPTRARRPAYSVLDTTKLRATFGIHLPPWGDGMDVVIGELASQKQ